MGGKVLANSMEVAGGATPHKCIAAMPDVCLSPPPPPAGPVPVPYPNTSKSADLKQGSKAVTIGDKPVCLENKSYYKTSPLGDEACTKSFGANVIDHGNAGKTYCQAHSSDTKVEKKGVTRTGDLTTSNHTSDQPGGGAMTPQVAGGGSGTNKDDEPTCPCCNGPLHVNQKDASGAPLKKTTSKKYYESKKAEIDKKSAGFDAWAAQNPHRLGETMVLKFGSDLFGAFSGTPAQIAVEEARRGKQMLQELEQLMGENKDCPNVHKSEDGCGTHFADVPPGAATAARKKEFADEVRDEANKRAASKLGRPVPLKTKVNHITPLDAGGCPKGSGNTVSDAELSGPCKKIDDLQTALQGR
jgi:hypothetical protein